MPLTPADIHNMVFRKSSLGRRGYDEEQVDALLDAVSAEMIQLLEGNDALRAHVHRAAAGEPAPDRAAEAEFAAALEQLDRERDACDAAERDALGLRGRLADARSRAAAERAAAERAAAGRADAAQRTGGAGGPIFDMARRTADQRMRDAQQEAQELLTDAREQSERIGRQAQATAEDITQQSRRRDSDAQTALTQRHTALVREVGELTEFAESYRNALRDHVRHQADA
jgi:DivIVA domain-containing protein